MRGRAGDHGFTLIELITTIAVMSIAAIGIASVVVTAARTEALALDFAEVTDRGTIASNWLYTELREMRLPASFGLQGTSTSELAFTDWNGRSIRYFLSDVKLMRSENGGAAQTFIDGVSAFKLAYRRADGSQTTNAYDVTRIDFAVTVTRGDVTRRYGGQVWPRTLGPFIANWREE